MGLSTSTIFPSWAWVALAKSLNDSIGPEENVLQTRRKRSVKILPKTNPNELTKARQHQSKPQRPFLSALASVLEQLSPQVVLGQALPRCRLTQ